MKILGFDPSLTNFGWVLIEIENKNINLIKSGRIQTKNDIDFIDRYVFIRQALIEIIKESNPDFIGCEYPIFKDIFSEGMYGLFLYTNEAIKLNNKSVVYFSPGQVKAVAKDFLGRPKSWKMQKLDMVEACASKSGIKKINHNEADAFWVAYLAGRFWQLYNEEINESELDIFEFNMFCKIHVFTKGKKKGQTKKMGIIHREDERFFCWGS
jgi:Holliday junction resolvasome RuvABC endonuclease subunit